MSQVVSQQKFHAWWENASVVERETFIERSAPKKKQTSFRSPGDLALVVEPSLVQTPMLDVIDKELILARDALAVMYDRRSVYSAYTRTGVPHLEAQQLVAEEVPLRGTNRLIMTAPPQEGKSWRVSRHFVLWLLQQFPKLRIAIVSYDGTNATRLTYDVRTDIELHDGQFGRFDLGLRLKSNQKAKSNFELITGSSIRGVGIGGGLTGFPVDLMIIDDPVKDYRDADSVKKSADAWNWWQTIGRTRLAPWGVVMIMTTRWSLKDLVGRLRTMQAEQEAAGLSIGDRWTSLNIKAQADYDPAKGESDPLGREPGEYLVSARGRSSEEWEGTRVSTVARFWNAMYQGEPVANDGVIFSAYWWRIYDEIMWTQAEDGSYRINGGFKVWQSWDLTFGGDSDTSDFVVGQVWATKAADSFLITQVRARMRYTQQIEAIKRLRRLFPQTSTTLIEKAANGAAAIETLQRSIPGIIPVKPTESKPARAEAVTPNVKSGNVFLPSTRIASSSPDIAFDVDLLLTELTEFPRGTHDDQVDAATQFLKARYEVGDGTVFAPDGQIPTGVDSATGASRSVPLSPIQARLAERSRGR